jgi:hypothetical protein
MTGFTLSPELQGIYRVTTHVPLVHHPTLGLVDFRTMTAVQAEEMIKAGTIYLVRIKKKKAVS